MSVVKINVLTVPQERAEVLEGRFAARAGEVDKVDGFESFQLLRPTEGTDKYLVVTSWRDEESFQAWMNSAAFTKGHAQQGGSEAGASAEAPGGHPGGESGGHPGGESGGHPGGAPQGGPAAMGSELWGFDVVTSSTKA
jgi:heme oxygenase (mycobilin-producing)